MGGPGYGCLPSGSERGSRLAAAGTRLSGVVHDGRWTVGVTSEGLIEFVLGCRLGVGFEVARAGIAGPGATGPGPVRSTGACGMRGGRSM